ncbi:MAG: hypothetical protein HYW63_00640 [Candidatus Levybacteria bacterium]|nr:hypothetical protein [Candidatus Levybacteria bacterium]
MNNFLDKKIPTLIGLSIIILGTVLTTFLVKRDTIFQLRAGPDQEPKNVKITNISDDSFTLTYITEDEAIGTLSYGESQNLLDNVVLDDRDQLSQSVNKYKIHSITTRDLNPDISYYFSITSGDKKYLDNENPYRLQTGKIINKNPSFQIPLNGKVVMPDGTPVTEGVVYVGINGAQELSTLINSDGTYTIPLNSLRTASFDDYFTINSTAIINIEIYSENLFSSVSVSPSEINPVPLITLSNNYDFSNFSTDPSPSPKRSTESGGFPTFGTISTNTGNPKILTPKKDEDLAEAKPTFEGTAQPNEVVEITIHSDESIITQVKADDSGKWFYTPPKDLSEGEHTITIVTKNKNGALETITHNFTVFATSEIGSVSSPPVSVITPQISPSQVNSLAANPLVIIAAVVGLVSAASGIVLFLISRGKSSM